MPSYEAQLDAGVRNHKDHPIPRDWDERTGTGTKPTGDPRGDFKDLYFHAQQIQTKTTWFSGMEEKYMSRDEECKYCGERWGYGHPPSRVNCGNCKNRMQPRDYKRDTGYTLRRQSDSLKLRRDGGNWNEVVDGKKMRYIHQEPGLLDTDDGVRIGCHAIKYPKRPEHVGRAPWSSYQPWADVALSS